MRKLLAIGTTLALGLAASSQSAANRGFVPLPELGGKDAGLQARFVGYQDQKVTIQVQNVTRQARSFQSAGLFFVPDGDPDKAPQRMGAAGPFEVQEQGRWRDEQDLKVAPGQTVTLRLKVFCLDSHRASPANGQSFRFAKQRLPNALRKDIEQDATSINTSEAYAPAAKSSAIQQKVWKHRNKSWIKLEGERANEKGSSPAPQRQLLRRRAPIEQTNVAP